MALHLFGQKPSTPPAGAGPGPGVGPVPGPGPAPGPETGTGGTGTGDILDVTDATFMKEVLEESGARPVVIDFWAPWCGPCRQLGPSLEKHVAAKAGAVRLAKVNIDENPQIAQQFRVQSIPAVFVIDQGKAFQGFTGALPDSQVKAFIDQLAEGAAGPDGGGIEEVLAVGAEALAAGDAATAAQAYASALQEEPGNLKAVAGLAKCYMALGEPDRAQEVIALAPETSTDPDVASVRAALKLAQAAAAAPDDTADLRAAVEADADDHQARFDLAGALAARGDFDAAVDHLLTIVGKDRTWNDDGARKQLLTVFEAAGPMSDAAKGGRKRLSSLLFS